MNILWKKITEFDTYSVSEEGKVWRDEHEMTYSNGRVRTMPEKEKQIQVRPKTGYNTVNLFKKQKYRQLYVHRLVAEAFIPNPDNLPQVNHKDGDKSNNHVSNLEWCSALHNMRHSVDIGLRPLGKDVHNSILNEEIVVQILDLYDTKMKITKIAELVGYGLYVVKHVCYNETWKHVKHPRLECKYLKN